MKKYIFILFLLITTQAFSQYWTPQTGVREIPRTNLNDIAVATMDHLGPVIYYNPNVANQLGPLVSAFFRAHEYGHHNLGHVVAGNNPYARAWLNLNAENAADAYAVRYHIRMGNINVLRATYNTFVNQPTPGDATHPPSPVRAQNIAALYYNITGTPL